MKTILVAFDGETWGPVQGASICIISDEEHDQLCEGSITPGDLKPLSEIILKEV